MDGLQQVDVVDCHGQLPTGFIGFQVSQDRVGPTPLVITTLFSCASCHNCTFLTIEASESGRFTVTRDQKLHYQPWTAILTAEQLVGMSQNLGRILAWTFYTRCAWCPETWMVSLRPVTPCTISQIVVPADCDLPLAQQQTWALAPEVQWVLSQWTQTQSHQDKTNESIWPLLCHAVHRPQGAAWCHSASLWAQTRGSLQGELFTPQTKVAWDTWVQDDLLPTLRSVSLSDMRSSYPSKENSVGLGICI